MPYQIKIDKTRFVSIKNKKLFMSFFEKKETIWLLNQQFQEEEEEYLLLKILKKRKLSILEEKYI